MQSSLVSRHMWNYCEERERAWGQGYMQSITGRWSGKTYRQSEKIDGLMKNSRSIILCQYTVNTWPLCFDDKLFSSSWLKYCYYPLLGGCYVYSSTINQLPYPRRCEGENISAVRVNNKCFSADCSILTTISLYTKKCCVQLVYVVSFTGIWNEFSSCNGNALPREYTRKH